MIPTSEPCMEEFCKEGEGITKEQEECDLTCDVSQMIVPCKSHKMVPLMSIREHV